MSFLSGTVSFSRFKIRGGSPKRLDEALLDKLRAHKIGRQRVVAADYEEAGWIGGQHLLDLEFDLEKNIVLDCLHFGLRIDSGRVPPDLMRAYVEMELASLREGNGNGNSRVWARLKKQATEAARQRADREVKDGRFRRLRQFPVLLDTQNDVLYAAATQPAVQERLHPLFKETFGRRLELQTAGSLARSWAERKGCLRKMDDLRPSAFVSRPEGNGDVYWTAHDSTSRDYLGNEFLLWLWHRLSEVSDVVEMGDKTEAAVLIVKHLTLECPWAETGKEVITCPGPAQLPESRRAIRSGKLPRKAGLIISRQGEQYAFTLQAETFSIGSAALPEIETNGREAVRARAEERVEQVRHLAETVDSLYGAFLKRRLSSDWPSELDKIRGWLRRG